MAKLPVSKGIFLGRYLPPDVGPSFMDWGLSPIDEEGNFVDLDNLPAGTDPLSLRLGAPKLLPGQENFMPFWDETGQKLRGAIDSENFAHTSMQKQIDEWRKDGVYGNALHAKVKEAGGLLTLKDVGLGPLEDAPANDKNSG